METAPIPRKAHATDVSVEEWAFVAPYQTLLSEDAAQGHGIRLEVARLPDARKGVELLLLRWVMERSFAWAAGVWRLGKDRECLSEAVAGQHVAAFAGQMLHRLVTAAAQSPQHARTGGEISLHVARGY